ncbi:MAG TPA: hypothetical protein VLD67_06690 [Vicinamibacterales bacterium]|nr:hypothetical protein [Vicinamibacterales bacterium]
MPPRPTFLLLPVLLSLAGAGAVWGQNPEERGRLGEMPLPGGLQAALAAIDDPVPGDRAQFLVELIRRTHQRISEADERIDPVVGRLLAHLDRATADGKAAATTDTLPLPLSADVWSSAVFGRIVAPERLAGAILRSRNASLLYAGLLSLDDETRAWMERQPDLVADLALRHAAAFLVASPGIRLRGSALDVPGGSAAETAWQALVGRRVNEPAAFIRALLVQREGKLAYFFGEMARLTAPQARFALNLDASDARAPVAAARRLLAVFERIAVDWRIADQPLRRPSIDPGTLLSELRADGEGERQVPGTRAFWRAVLADGWKSDGLELAPQTIGRRDRVDFAWLCEQVFNAEPHEHQRRYRLVLFASRALTEPTPVTAVDAVEAVRAAGTYPALVAALERANLRDVGLVAGAARRAARLSRITDEPNAVRALAQFQGALNIVIRAASRGGLPPDTLPGIVSSLSAVEVSDRGDYEGRLVAWMGTHLRSPAAPVSSIDSSGIPDEPTDGMDEQLLRLLAGRPDDPPRVVEWEGNRYRVDLAQAEQRRLSRLIGERTRALLASSPTLVAIADALSAPPAHRSIAREADRLERVARVAGLVDGSGWEGTDVPVRYRAAADALRRAGGGGTSGVDRVAPALRLLADDFLARGLSELSYVVALGHHDMAWAPARAIAGRHDFALATPAVGRLRPWGLPTTGIDKGEDWHVTGPLLGLDVTLAELTLRRLSSKPPVRKPSLGPEDRRVLIDGAALTSPVALADADRRTLVGAIGRGRARLSEVRTAREAFALADAARLSASRRSLLAWVATHDRDRMPVFLSLRELLWLGLDWQPLDPRLDAWGVSARPRTGCSCLQLFDRRQWEAIAGRWGSGLLASAFPDLNLRLAELLEDLGMPAPLLVPVLAAATLDLVNSVAVRDRDDYRGLLEFVLALDREQVEQYLALLTTDGPLVPIVDGASGEASR